MASLRERHGPAGTSWAILFRDPTTGRQTSRTFHDLPTAQEHLARIERMGPAAADTVLAAKQGRDPDAHLILTTADLVAQHVAGLRGIEKKTRAGYEAMARELRAMKLGQIPAAALTTTDVGTWAESLAKAGQSEKTIRNKHALLSAALAGAVTTGLLSRNVAKQTRIARQERPELVTLTPADVQLIISRATPHYRPLLIWLYGTGMRLGEATAVQIRDLHLDQSPPTVTVQRAWKADGVTGAPKTRAGTRTIALPGPVVDAIRPLVINRPADALLFTNMYGRRVLQPNLHRLWRAWCADVEWNGARWVPRTDGVLGKVPRLHDLRSAHASQMIAAGINLFDLQHRLGHTSITTTANTYGRLLPEAQVQAARAAALAFEPAAPPLAITDAPQSPDE